MLDKPETEPHLLVVGGTGRNVGKTEFITRLIRNVSQYHHIYALKVSSIYPDEALYHGNHSATEEQGILFEEIRRQTNKDTSRMLRAGAKKVYYLRAEDKDVMKGYEEFVRQIPSASLVVCESNSLTQFIQPQLDIVVRNAEGPVKPRAVSRLKSADLVVISDGKSGFPELNLIEFSRKRGWRLVSRDYPEGRDL